MTVAAYVGGEPTKAYLEPVAVGDAMPSLPKLLDAHTYLSAPLEAAYELTWSKCPAVVRGLVEHPETDPK